MEEKENSGAFMEIANLVTSEAFQNVPENIQEKALNSIQIKNENKGGFMGKIFGTEKENAAMHIAFALCCILLIFCGIDMIHAFNLKETGYTELVKAVLPIVTLTIGYIFGKGEK